MRPVVLLPLLLAACPAPPGDRNTAGPLHPGEPRLTAVDCSCSIEEESWSFTVEADAWTAGGTLYLALEPSYVESHPLSSLAAAEDGTWDRLGAELEIVADWRDAGASSTAFLCNASTREGLSFRLFVYAPGGEESDCLGWGADPEVLDEAGVELCEDWGLPEGSRCPGD